MLKDGTNHGGIFPVVCGVATKNLGTNRLLDAIVEDLPSPVKHGAFELPEVTLEPDEDKELFAFVFKTKADQFAGRINFFRVYQGVMRPDTQVLNTRAHAKERIGTLIVPEGREQGHADAFGPGRHRRRGQAQGDARRRLAGRPRRADRDARDQAAPAGHGLRDRAQDQGRRGQGLHGAAPPPGGGPDDRPAPRPADGRADRRRAVADARRGRRRPPEARFGAEVDAQAAARPLPGDDPQAGQGARAPQEADRRPRPVRRLPHRDRAAARGRRGFEFVDAIKGGVIPQGFIPAVEKGCVEAMPHGVVAGFPVKGVRVRLYDGSYHSVDSSRDGVQDGRLEAMRQALEQAGAVLLEPIMLVTLCVPDDAVGDVIGDLNSRRGRPQGMEPRRRA